jgi:DNA-binding CsgD family transcriptional regulator
MRPDAISIVEAAYDCDSDDDAWYDRLVEQVAPGLDRGFGVVLSTYAPERRPEDVTFHGTYATPELLQACRTWIVEFPDSYHYLLTSAGPISMMTQVMGLDVKDADHWPPFATYLRPWGVQDALGLVARDPSGHAVCIVALYPDVRRLSRREQGKWSRVAAHIVAGRRLRRALPAIAGGDIADGAEAILTPSGAIAHAESPAQGKGARESLRHAAKSIDRARSKARGNEEEALELWQGLVAGRWSLVDRFDTDGRRYLVARKNEPDVKDPRALSARERHVLAYAAMGQSLKLIAYSLGLSLSTVSVNRRTAMRKLGLHSQADIVALFSPVSPGVVQGR